MNLPFSIIVPVYNDEKYLRRCIASIFSQTFQNFEILLINDGSTDSSPALCDEFAQKDSRIRVFHKENEGTSKTRQLGIDNANGEYIFFVDSDDFIEQTFINDVLNEIKYSQSDILFFDFYEENASGKKIYYSQNPLELDVDNVIQHILEGRLFSCLWNIVIKKEFYTYNNIHFKKGINYGEDTLFILELLLNNPKISYIPKAYYHHSQNYASFTRTNKKQRFLNRIEFLNYLPVILEKYNRNDLIKYNFFPLNDKFEILYSGAFTKNEYKKLFSISAISSYAKKKNIIKYYILLLSENHLYLFSRFISKIIRICKKAV